MSSVELELVSDDVLQDSDYDLESDCGSRLLRPVAPVSPRKHRHQQPVRQRSTFSDRGHGSSSHYYASGSSGDLTTTTSSEGSHRGAKHYHSYISPLSHERNQIEILAAENRRLKQENLILQTEVSTIKDLYCTLTQSLPRLLTTACEPQSLNLRSMTPHSPALTSSRLSTSDDPPLDHNNYPKVRYWFRKNWIDRKREKSSITKVDKSSTTEKKAKGRAPLGLNVTLRYVEDEHGIVVDGFRASDMRKFARSIWNQLMGAGKAPKTWGKADLDVASHYRREMRIRFPELALCEFDWKAEQLATDNYPNWAANTLQAVKEEPANNFLTTKRRRDSADHSSKRAKTENNSPLNVESITTCTTGPISASTDSTSITTLDNLPSSTATPPVPTTAVPNAIPATVPTITVTLNAEEFRSPVNETYPISTSNATTSTVGKDQPKIDSPSNTFNSISANHILQHDTAASVSQEPREHIIVTTATIGSKSSITIAEKTPTLPTESAVNTPPAVEAMVKMIPRALNPLLLEPLSAIVQSDQGAPLVNPTAMSLSPAIGNSSLILSTTPSMSTDISQTPDSTKKPGMSKKSSKMRPGTSNTARNICARDWVQSNPLGSAAEFKVYYDNLSAEEKKKYQDLQSSLKAS